MVTRWRGFRGVGQFLKSRCQLVRVAVRLCDVTSQGRTGCVANVASRYRNDWFFRTAALQPGQVSADNEVAKWRGTRYMERVSMAI